MKLTTCCLLMAAVLAAPTHAALIAYENFDTTAGTNNISGSSGTGNSGFSTNWTTIGDANGGNIINPGYTYSGLDAAGNRAQVFNASANSDSSATYFYRTLSSPFTVGANSTGTVWASFLIQATAASGSGLGATIGFFSTTVPTASTNSGVTIGAVGQNTNYRVANRALDTSGTGVVSTTGTNAGTLSLAVFKFTINTNAGANETFSLWLSPDLSEFDGAEGSLGTAVLSNQSLSNMGINSISSIAFGSNYVSTGTPTLGLDEIRLGTTVAAVIPEPRAALLGGLGLLMLLRRRRNA